MPRYHFKKVKMYRKIYKIVEIDPSAQEGFYCPIKYLGFSMDVGNQ
jgi:hypothetical protein